MLLVGIDRKAPRGVAGRAFAAALLFFVGCSPSVAEPTVDPYESNPRAAPPITLDEFCTARAASCAAQAACTGDALPDCKGDVRQLCLDEGQAHQAAGLVFDPKAAGVCAAIEHTRNVTYCLGMEVADTTADYACRAVFSHGAGEGAACEPPPVWDPPDCAFDADTNAGCVDGRCQHLPLAGLGQACTYRSDLVACGLGLTCIQPPGSTEGTCVPRSTEGQSCALAYCAEGLRCEDPGTCVRPRPRGATCDSDQQCRYHCRYGECT